MRILGATTFLALVLSVCADSRDFFTDSFNNCVGAEFWSKCLKHQVLEYLDNQLGTSTDVRSFSSSSNDLDEAIISRTFKYLKSYDYSLDLPYIDGKLQYRPSRSLADLDIKFKDDHASSSEARGLLKKKLLLPVLLLLKLKFKALMPIFVAIIGLKAMKALILSKLALLIVIAFVALQFFKKGGMMPPPGMAMELSSNYGVPASTTSGYEPVNTWDGNGPYSRVWTPSNGVSVDAQSLAYNYYAPGSSASSYGSPSSSSSSSSSANLGSSTNY